MMHLYVVFFSFLLNFLPEAFGGPCEDISGRWYNQLGSEVDIDHLEDGKLFGKFYTAVSLANAKVVDGGRDLVGLLPYNKPGSSFAFSVTFYNGSSTMVWTGQCQECDGKEILETSWLLRSYVDSCIDKWKSTLIGKDTFYRKLKTPGSNEPTTNRPNLPEPSLISSKCNDLRGIWYNDLGSEMILNETKDGIITGEYRTAVERKKGSAGTTHSIVYGSGAFGNENSTFSLMIVWRAGASVTGFVGQCHICGKNKTVILEMNWLLRKSVETCIDVWQSTLYGVNSFTRHEQRSGPRKSSGTHTPKRGEDGEDGQCTGSSPKFTVANLWVICLLLSCAEIGYMFR